MMIDMECIENIIVEVCELTYGSVSTISICNWKLRWQIGRVG